MLHYAAIGSRVSSFHHDAASKLQSLMMALDEIGELVGERSSELRQATETARAALHDLNQLFTINRALAKTPQRKRTAIGEVMMRAADRHGVKLRGTISAVDLQIAPASITHAFATLLDISAGRANSQRTVELTIASDGDRATITFAGTFDPTKPAPNLNELVAVATFLIAREDGDLRCTASGFIVQLPIAPASGPVPR